MIRIAARAMALVPIFATVEACGAGRSKPSEEQPAEQAKVAAEVESTTEHMRAAVAETLADPRRGAAAAAALALGGE
jgi:hypothetical protein